MRTADVLGALFAISVAYTAIEHPLAATHGRIDQAPAAASTTARTIPGDKAAMGKGSVWSWVLTTADGAPAAVGATLTESALSGLPARLTPGVIGVETLLPLPKVKGLPFDHVAVDWNPRGHPPVGVYSVPHFDVHFYMITRDQRDEIVPIGEGLAKTRREPPAEFVPAGYIVAPDSEVPGMGMHWIDPTSHELHGKPFTHTFIYGSHDGAVVFLEPMFSKVFLETRPDVRVPLKLPAKFQRPGYYPTHYAIRFDPGKKEFSVLLDGLTRRE